MKRSVIRDWCHHKIIPGLRRDAPPSGLRPLLRPLLTRYALERLLYRLSISDQRDQFLPKGALLFDLWFDVPHRPTHDADFLGFGSAEIPRLEEVFRDISRIEVEDGIVFQSDSVKAAEIRKDANYAGVRVTLVGLLEAPAVRDKLALANLF